MHAQIGNSASATRVLADRAGAYRFEELPDDIIELSGQCLLDFFAVSLAGSRSEPVQLLLDAALEEGGDSGATVLGRSATTTPFWASWINGTAAHVYVYDDVNMMIPGHGSATTFPAVLALAERYGASGRQVIEAFVAGYETSCAIGAAISPSHYEMGYHASSTIGSFGATAAAGRLHGLSGEQIAEAFGIASTMASGFKGVFGAMAKCVQVGRASATGIIAADLAKRGMKSGGTIFEHRQGFIAAQSKVDPAKVKFSAPAGSFALRSNLFKYYAACYMANAPIECALAIREALGPRADGIQRIDVVVNPAIANVCDIKRPATALEAKYSVRTVVAMALNEISPASLDNFERVAADFDLVVNVADITDVVFDEDFSETECEIRVHVGDGEMMRHRHDAGIAERDLARQGKRLQEKFDGFVTPILGKDRTVELREAILELPSHASLAPIFKIARQSAE